MGKVKTRIAKDVGDGKALEIYLSLLEHTRLLTLQVDACRYVYYSNYIDSTDKWLAIDFDQKLQSDGDLGNRMYTAFHELTQMHDKTMIIGSDCLQVTPDIIEDGFTALDTHDAVIGPSEDGGYYLLGMKKSNRSVFEKIAWSTSLVFQETMIRFASLEWSTYLLPTLSDIDFIEDWEKYKHYLVGS